MENRRTVEPGMYSVSSQGPIPGSETEMVVVVQEEDEEPGSFSYYRIYTAFWKDKLGLGQAICGAILMGIGYAVYRSVPYGLKDSFYYIDVFGGAFLAIAGLAIVLIGRDQATKAKTGVVIGLSSICILSVVLLSVVSTLAFTKCLATMCRFCRGSEICISALEIVLSVCKVFKSWHKLHTDQTDEQMGDNGVISDTEQSMTIPIVNQDVLSSSSFGGQDRFVAHGRETSSARGFIPFPLGPPPAYSDYA